MLEKICQQVSIPVIAIGGLTSERIKTLASSKISGAAFVSAIMKAENPEQASQVLKEVLQSM